FLRASDLGVETDNSEWKPVIIDGVTDEIIVPNGTMGQRWEEEAKWNLILENEDGTTIDPAMSVEEHGAEWVDIVFPYFDDYGDGTFTRSIPVKKVTMADGSTRLVATVYDLMLSQYGVKREGATHVATGYDDE